MIKTKTRLRLFSRKMTFVALLVTLAVTGCKKDEKSLEKVNEEKIEVVTIAQLKVFMSEITGIEVNSIQYNPGNEQFIWRGINQISHADLLLAYEQHIYAIQNKDKEWKLK